jgi:hypothetical protein
LQALLERAQGFGGQLVDRAQHAFVVAFDLRAGEDASSRAASAALAIQKAMDRYRQGQADLGSASVLLHTVRAGSTLHEDLRQPKTEVLRAAEPTFEALASVAEPGTIVISPATVSLLRRRFALERPVAVPGVEGHAYRLVGLEWTGYGLGGRPLSDFVGRKRELVHLHELLASAARGRGQAVGIMGEAGIGKSRLMFEFCETLGYDGIAHWEGRCVPHGTGVPYLPLVDLLRRHFRIMDGDRPDEIRARLQAEMQATGVDSRSLPYLLCLLGIETGTEELSRLSAETMRLRTFEALHQLLLLNGRRPLVVVIEDVHWIDRASEAFLDALVGRIGASRIMLLVSYRPGYRPRWLEHSHAAQVTLPGLTPTDSLAIVEAIVREGRLAAPLARSLVERADGNPFFLEELAWSLRDGGGTEDMPATIQAAIGARIGRLSDETAHCLVTASVLGRTFSNRLLVALTGNDGDLSAHI